RQLARRPPRHWELHRWQLLSGGRHRSSAPLRATSHLRQLLVPEPVPGCTGPSAHASSMTPLASLLSVTRRWTYRMRTSVVASVDASVVGGRCEQGRLPAFSLHD